MCYSFLKQDGCAHEKCEEYWKTHIWEDFFFKRQRKAQKTDHESSLQLLREYKQRVDVV